jgi:hypothetical protein
MINIELEHIADLKLIEVLASDANIKLAQDGTSSILDSVKDYVRGIFDKDHPFGSIMSFIGPTLLWKLNFKWMAVLIEVAGALGFNWKGFWESVKNGVVSLIKSFAGNKPSEAALHSSVKNTVKESVESNISGEPDEEKLQEIAANPNKFACSIEDAIAIKKYAQFFGRRRSFSFGRYGGFRNKLLGFFISVISWLVSTSLISLGFAVGGGLISSIFHKKHPSSDSQQENAPQSNQENAQTVSTQQPVQQLQMGKHIPQDIFEIHQNDEKNDIWLEKSNIENIETEVMSWILYTYPQLRRYTSEIEGSSGFQTIIQKFKIRNRLAQGLGLVAVPPPYQRKVDIVSDIVNRFLREQPINQEQPQQRGTNVQYR